MELALCHSLCQGENSQAQPQQHNIPCVNKWSAQQGHLRARGDGSAQQGQVGPRGEGRWETLSSWDNSSSAGGCHHAVPGANTCTAALMLWMAFSSCSGHLDGRKLGGKGTEGAVGPWAGVGPGQ